MIPYQSVTTLLLDVVLLMVNGTNGVRGARAPTVALAEVEVEHEHVTTRRRRKVALRAKEIQMKLRLAMNMHVQCMENGEYGASSTRVLNHAEAVSKSEPESATRQHPYMEVTSALEMIGILSLAISIRAQLMESGATGEVLVIAH